MFVIHFFWLHVSSKIFLSLFLQKIRRPALFSCKRITFNSNPANICWSSRHLEERHVLKASSTSLQRINFSSSKTSWDVLKTSQKNILRTPSRQLQDDLEDKKLLRWRLLEDVWKTYLENVLKTCPEGVLKTCLEDVLKTLWRQTKCLLEISLSTKSDPANLDLYLRNLYFTNLYLTNLRQIQHALIRTQ